MITFNQYQHHLISKGATIGDIRRNQSNDIIDATFTGDTNYKRVRILTRDGWKFEDAKYQYHSAQSMSKDQVDWFLQFRPGVHYPVGTYVIVPDDTTTIPHTFDQEKELLAKIQDGALPDGEQSQLWFIVGRNRAGSFVRYMILQCNWIFKWVYNKKIMQVIGSVRNANSYTS